MDMITIYRLKKLEDDFRVIKTELKALQEKINFLENVEPYNPKDIEETLIEVKDKTIEEIIEENMMKEGWY